MKKIALLHRYPQEVIRETNAAFPYLKSKGIDVLTFKTFDRINNLNKFWKSLLWIVYAPMLVFGKCYDVIYCDDSYPFYPALVKLFSPKSKVVIRLGDLHLMYHYSGLSYKVLHFFEKISWRLADNIIVISEPMQDFLLSEGFFSDVVYDPVDQGDFLESKWARVYLPMDCIMFHGLLTKNKNVDILLKAADLLPDMDFFIIGDGPDFNRLKKIAPPNVFFKGWVPFRDISQYIEYCKIGVALRSDNPGNDFVVTSPFLQYGIMGKPCLVTRRKVFGDYEWQFSSAEELVEKIKELNTRPGEGEKLRRYIIENHDAKKIAKDIWQILTQQ